MLCKCCARSPLALPIHACPRVAWRSFGIPKTPQPLTPLATGSGCTGTESYYLPYDGYVYQCRTWNDTGQCGTIHRTVTNRSYRYNGTCYDAWLSGNTLSDFVTVYR
jgi:hypothetical protein